MPTDPVHEITRAVDQLMTQVKYIADHLTPPVINVSPGAVVVSGRHADAPTTRGRCDVLAQTGARCTKQAEHWSPQRDDPHTFKAPDNTAFRDALLVLLSRAARGVLTPDEGPLLRQHVERALGDRDQLAAATGRVRSQCDTIGNERNSSDDEGFWDGAVDAVARIRIALDGPTAEG